MEKTVFHGDKSLPFILYTWTSNCDKSGMSICDAKDLDKRLQLVRDKLGECDYIYYLDIYYFATHEEASNVYSKKKAEEEEEFAVDMDYWDED